MLWNVLSLFVYFVILRARAIFVYFVILRARAHIQQLVHSATTIEKCWSYVRVTFKTKFEMHIPREFPGYWWLFRMHCITALGWLKKEQF